MTDNGITNINISLQHADEIINQALREDVGPGDITTDNIIPEDKTVSAFMKSKEEGVVAGLEITERVFTILSKDIKWKQHYNDGDKVKPGDILVEIDGPHRALLTGERTALNFLQRMSGIATQTSRFVDILKPYKTRILDTRKTVPGLRLLDKYAVKAGGGTNHRIGLYDMVMIKDNHIKVAGGIKQAVEKVRSGLASEFKIEVETSNLDEVREALDSGADIIMLDNMDNETMKAATELIQNKALTEASGNMSLERIKEVAECGIDFISVGSLTHSVTALDIGMYIKD